MKNGVSSYLEKAGLEMGLKPLQTATVTYDGQDYDIIRKPDCPGSDGKNPIRYRPHSDKPWHEEPTPQTQRLRDEASKSFEEISKKHGLKNARIGLFGSGAGGYAIEGSDLEYFLMIDLSDFGEIQKDDLGCKTEEQWKYVRSLENRINNINTDFQKEIEDRGIEPGHNFFMGFLEGQRVLGKNPVNLHIHDYFFPGQGFVENFDYKLPKKSEA